MAYSANQPPQAKFSRASLNVMMMLCLILIVIFSGTFDPKASTELPSAPKLDVRIWQTDSASTVWYSPMVSQHIVINIWYQAGFRYDGQLKGRAYLLSQLLQGEAKQRKLSMDMELDSDFLKIALRLPSTGLQLSEQIKQAQRLLTRPSLPNNWLPTLRQTPHNITEQLRSKLFQGQAHGGPKTGTAASLASISRSDIQKFHQQFMQPARAHVAISGDIDETSAHIILERLLPPSIHPVIKTENLPISNQVKYLRQQDRAILALPGALNHPQHQLTAHLLQAILSQQFSHEVTRQESRLQHVLFINQASRLTQSMQEKIDWDMMARLKRQLALAWIKQVQTTAGLSRYLVELNAHGFAINHLSQTLDQLAKWDKSHWQETQHRLQQALSQPTATATHTAKM